VSPVRYELGFYIPEDDILHSHRGENLKSYTFAAYVESLRASRSRCHVDTLVHVAAATAQLKPLRWAHRSSCLRTKEPSANEEYFPLHLLCT
jgi:hypothetical protein